jgi:hypothetical protein
MKDKRVIIGIDHEEFKEGSYNGVYYVFSDLERHTVNTGNAEKDFNETINMLKSKGYSIMFSSTVDNFMMDNSNLYEWIE